jgi:hypothetical protein
MQLKQKNKKNQSFFFFIFSLIWLFFTENKINQIQAEGLVEKYQCIEVKVSYGDSIKNSTANFLVRVNAKNSSFIF